MAAQPKTVVSKILDRQAGSYPNLYRLQLCVGCWISENSQHRDDLALVMKCVGYDVQQDKSGTTEFAAPIQGTLGKGRVELLFREIADVDSCRLSYSVFGS
jgi:hypothetical protein